MKLAAKRVCGKILMTLAEGIASDIGGRDVYQFYALHFKWGGRRSCEWEEEWGRRRGAKIRLLRVKTRKQISR